jgi:hypothetical protein
MNASDVDAHCRRAIVDRDSGDECDREERIQAMKAFILSRFAAALKPFRPTRPTVYPGSFEFPPFILIEVEIDALRQDAEHDPGDEHRQVDAHHRIAVNLVDG